jgi:hypothetical protein
MSGKKAPAIVGRGKLSRAGVSDQFGPSRSAFTGRAEHPLVAGHTSWVLFICAKNCPTGPGTKTFEIDQSFEPGARNRRPTAVGAALKMSASSMSDDFDGLDATEKAAIRATLIRCRVLAAKIANELRNKRPEQFVDKLLLADLYASLEHAARLLEQKRR